MSDATQERQTLLSAAPAEQEAYFDFLSLAPEVRNQVYEALLEHAEPLRIADTDGYGVLLHRFVGEGSDLLEFSKHPRNALTRATDLKGAYQPGLALLRVSRQIHGEAAPIFYKQNVFQISWNRNLREFGYTDCGRYMLRAAIPWLTGFRIYGAMLRKLEIDLSRLCPAGCWHTGLGQNIWPTYPQDLSALIEVGPLLYHIWRANLKELEVVFVRSRGHRQGCGQRAMWGVSGQAPHNGCNLLALNKLFNSVRHDEHKFGRYWHTIGNIGLRRDGSGGAVAFRSQMQYGDWRFDMRLGELGKKGCSYCTNNIDFFEVTAGNNVRLLEREPVTLLTITDGLFPILRMALSYYDFHTVNLDTSVGLRRLTGPFFVKQAWNNYPCLVSNSYNFEVTTANGMERLHRYLRGLLFIKTHNMRVLDKRPDMESPAISERLVRAEGMQVTLGFDVSDSQDIRLDVVKLIDATLILVGKCKVLIRPRDPNLTTAFTLFELRRLAMRAWPRIDPESDKSFPEISINGLGKIIEVEDGAPRTQDANTLIGLHEIVFTANAKMKNCVDVTTTLEELFPRQGSSQELLEWLRDDGKGGVEPKSDYVGTHEYWWRKKYQDIIGVELQNI